MLTLLFFSCTDFEKSESQESPDSAEETQTEPILPFSTLYLLSRDLGEDGRIHQLNTQTMTSIDLGEVDCDFESEHDYLAALTSDPKGMLWALSKRYGIYRVHPQQLTCSYSGVTASSELFQADSLTFHQEGAQERYFLSGYYSTGDASASTALAVMENGVIDHIGGISNFEGQGNVMDLAAVSDGRLYGLRSWGNYAELARYSTSSATQLKQFRIPIDNGEAFAFIVDDQIAWIFTATNPTGGSRLHRYDIQQESIIDTMDLNLTVVGAAGLY